MADDYQVLEELGSGSFGVVYKGIEKKTGELVAIKHIDLEGSDDDIEEIQQEISVLSACASRHVTQYKVSFVRGVKLWIVMEYLGGGSCLDLLKPGPFSEEYIAIICRELLLGLDYLHGSGKIHRDIKAANVLLANSGRVKIADFGVAAQLTNIKSQRLTFVGTPFWMAPEVIQEAGYDFKADIWSLGITAMELANGEPPNASTHPMKVLFLIPKAPAPRLEPGRWSKEFQDFIAKCLIKDPDRRSTAKELLRHKFIRNAGKVEMLRDLIARRRRSDALEEKNAQLRYYEETIRDMSSRTQQQEEWIFDTVKPVKPSLEGQTQRRRKVSRAISSADDAPHDMIDRLSVNDENIIEQTSSNSSLRKSSNNPSTSPLAKSPNTSTSLSKRNKKRNRRSSTVQTARRVSSNQQPAAKQPLGLDLSLGNTTSASTVRLFRQESNVTSKQTNAKIEAAQISTSSTIYSSPAALVSDENAPPPDLANPSRTTSFTTATKKERRDATQQQESARTQPHLYKAVVSPAIHDILSQSGNDATTRDALTRLASAWRNLENVDANTAASLLQALSQRVQASTATNAIDRQAIQSTSSSLTRSAVQKQPQQQQKTTSFPDPPSSQQTSFAKSGSTSSSTSSTSSSSSASTTSPQKLFLAQSNPHLKSHHRRRQSAIMPGERGRDDVFGYDTGYANENSTDHSIKGYRPVSMMASTVLEEEQQQQQQHQQYRYQQHQRGGYEYGYGYGRGDDDVENDDLERKMPDYVPEGMPAVASMAEALYGRWLEGMKTRWARMG